MEKTFRTLEWDKILDKLKSFAQSEIGKSRCADTPVYNEFNRINHSLMLTSEAKLLLESLIYPPIDYIADIKELMDISLTGASLDGEELIAIARTIRTSRLLKSFFARYAEETPLLKQEFENLFENKFIEDEILQTFDESGEVLDSASPELKSLRSSLRDKFNNLKNRLNSLLTSFSSYLQDPVYTQRDNRYVLPVKVEYKSKVDGIVHDVSSSGATVFIEPKSIVEMNNVIKETEIKIDAEIRRILSELTAKVSEYAHPISIATDVLAEVDFTFAKAKYSIELKAIAPSLNKSKQVVIKNLKHPILMTVIDYVVPNDIEIGKNFDTLIITGSNTGGKTVTLKALGLSILMTRAGLHIPAEEADVYPFESIFADIGDEQSVIQSLSTFSGHITNIIKIVNHANDNSLVLMDEVGAGTDPAEGSALAQAILENLQAVGTKTIVTTHYGELKTLAFKNPRFQNASVEFNVETLKPTYRLNIGIPGNSNAITISRNLGLKQDITTRANEIYITQKDVTGVVLQGLQEKSSELSKTLEQTQETQSEIEILKQDYEKKLEKIRADKKKTIEIFKKKFETDLQKTREEIRKILHEVRVSKSEKIARRAYNRLAEIESDQRENIYAEQSDIEPEYKAVDWSVVKPGANLYLKDLNQIVELLSLPDKNKNVQIQMGMIKTSVKVSKLFLSDKPVKKVQKQRSKGHNFSFDRTEVGFTLDLRGARVDDALDRVEKYLDDASLAGLAVVYIIHGHGTGALKDAIREYFRTSPYVRNFEPAKQAEGGDGVSVVELV